MSKQMVGFYPQKQDFRGKYFDRTCLLVLFEAFRWAFLMYFLGHFNWPCDLYLTTDSVLRGTPIVLPLPGNFHCESSPCFLSRRSSNDWCFLFIFYRLLKFLWFWRGCICMPHIEETPHLNKVNYPFLNRLLGPWPFDVGRFLKLFLWN